MLPTLLNNLYKHYLGDDWKWAKALSMVESSENPWEIGDSGLAVGILQQHPDFQQDYIELLTPWLRWLPPVQLAVLQAFWKKHSSYDNKTKCWIYHYGSGRWQAVQDINNDPDKYLERVEKALALIG